MTITTVALGGVFDGLHLGHLDLIHEAAAIAAPVGRLVVLLNDEESLDKQKRKTQHSYDQRRQLIEAALASSPTRLTPDLFEVRPFSEADPSTALGRLVEERGKYIIFLKGADTVEVSGTNPGHLRVPELAVRGVLFGFHPLTLNGLGQLKLRTRAGE